MSVSDDEENDEGEEEQEEEKQEEKKAIGPKCDVCGQSTDSLYPVLVKREHRGMYEMVQIYLCAYHYVERMEEDTLPPPEEEQSEDEDEDEDDGDENDDFGYSSNREGQSWG